MPDTNYGLRSLDGTTAPKAKMSHRKNVGKMRKLIGMLIIIIIVIAGGWLLFDKLRHKPNLDDVRVIMADVSRHYTLPTNETPALATVTDSTKVQSAFAGKVHNGDKILIYQNNKKAIVYRPSIDRIVDVEPVSIDTPPSADNTTH